MFVSAFSVNGIAGTGYATRCQLAVNGSVVSAPASRTTRAATNVVVPIAWVGDL